MAQKTHIVLTDDLAGDDTPADETVVFALDGTTYEIDLTNKNADDLRGILLDYTAKARKVTGSRGRGKASSKVNAGASDAKVIREWAVANKIDVPERGRIPADVREKYEAAQ